MKTVKLGTEVRLPAEVTRRLRLRKGARLAVITTGDSVQIVPLARIPKDQLYFYSDEWQAKEREAEEDIRAGRTKEFSDVDALIRDLRGV